MRVMKTFANGVSFMARGTLASESPERHLSGAHRAHPSDEDLPVSTAAAKEVLCLPVFPELTNAEVEAVSGAVRAFFGA